MSKTKLEEIKKLKINIIVGCKSWSVGRMNEKMDELIQKVKDEEKQKEEDGRNSQKLLGNIKKIIGRKSGKRFY